MRVHALSLGRQSAIHQRTALQKAVEHRNQRVLMVVPPQAELLLLLVIHFPIVRRLADPKTAIRLATTNTA